MLWCHTCSWVRQASFSYTASGNLCCVSSAHTYWSQLCLCTARAFQSSHCLLQSLSPELAQCPTFGNFLPDWKHGSGVQVAGDLILGTHADPHCFCPDQCPSYYKLSLLVLLTCSAVLENAGLWYLTELCLSLIFFTYYLNNPGNCWTYLSLWAFHSCWGVGAVFIYFSSLWV